jgi:biotin carboxyl carrier protein
MADRLNGGNGGVTSRRQLRVSFAPGTAPGSVAVPAGTAPGIAATPGMMAAPTAPAGTPGVDPEGTGAWVVDMDGGGLASLDGSLGTATLEQLAPPVARLHLNANGKDGESHQVLVATLDHPGRAASGIRRLEIVVDGWRFELDVESEARARLRERATSARADAARGGPQELRAIIPGRVVSVDVAEGDAVEPGGRLLVLEAMKMQNEVRAPRAGTVVRVAVGPGQTVELGDVLVVIE